MDVRHQVSIIPSLSDCCSQAHPFCSQGGKSLHLQLRRRFTVQVTTATANILSSRALTYHARHPLTPRVFLSVAWLTAARPRRVALALCVCSTGLSGSFPQCVRDEHAFGFKTISTYSLPLRSPVTSLDERFFNAPTP